MGILSVSEFISLDGVVQAPGGPHEDTEGGFRFGGWQAPFFDDESRPSIMADIDALDALLLGRKTYDIFAGYWPNQSADNPIAAKFDAVPKFVASRTLTHPTWQGTTVLADAVDGVRDLKERFERITVIGSADYVQTLLMADLVDRLQLWLYPVSFGSGKRLFAGGTIPATFRLVQPPQGFPGGAVSLVYERAGAVETGDMSETA